MKSLVIAEKPSVARDIARVLHCSQKGNGTLEGKDYVVTWALGHLVTLADPEEYDKKYTKWELSYEVLFHPAFVRGSCTTAFLDRSLPELLDFSRRVDGHRGV